MLQRLHYATEELEPAANRRVGRATTSQGVPYCARNGLTIGVVRLTGPIGTGGEEVVTAKSDPAPPDAAVALARRLGIGPGATVAEIGYDTDTDELVGEAISAGSGEDPVGEDHDGVVDVALLWWRDGDGDLADVLVDVMAPLIEGGVIWLFTPKFGRTGAVEPADIAEAAQSAGMRRTKTLSLPAWSATRLVVR